ncbi:LAFA_0E14532g1_1 [Lachancea sp. 'fantastica']|nr:LAFA_0E14532g1_1 [Lachancea sp. 'fantastica']
MAQEFSSASDSVMSEGSRASTAATQTKSDDESQLKKKPRANKGLLNLLDDAFKYSAYNEFSMPNGFLRKRKRSAETQTTKSQDDQGSNASLKDTVVANGDQLASSMKEHAAQKVVSKGSNGNFDVRKSRRKTATPPSSDDKVYQQPRSRAASVTVKAKNLPKGAIRKSRSPSLKPAEKSTPARKTSGKKSVGRPKKVVQVTDSFVSDWATEFTALPEIFDLQKRSQSTAFESELIHSSQVTLRRDDQDKILKLRYILFPEFEEEFVINFSSDLSRYNPMSEVGRIVELTDLVYLPKKYRSVMKSKIVAPLNKAFDQESESEFIDVINRYNDFIKNIPREEIIRHLESLDKVPTALLHSLLHMIYVRTIHPNAGSLKKYQAFSNYVYGELLPRFLTTAYKQCDLKPDHIFMDLGSGVGNCVFQAAAEFGCKMSFGCELMPHASMLTEAQKKEFENRFRLYGLKVGPTQFSLRKSFIDNPAVQELLPRCDVLLVNNFIFDAQLNELVRKLIQPLKVGCKIITLKDLRPLGYTMDYTNTDNILNRLKVEKFDLAEDSVSWTHRGGEYYVSTVLQDIDESIFLMHSKGRVRARTPIKYTR